MKDKAAVIKELEERLKGAQTAAVKLRVFDDQVPVTIPNRLMEKVLREEPFRSDEGLPKGQSFQGLRQLFHKRGATHSREYGAVFIISVLAVLKASKGDK